MIQLFNLRQVVLAFAAFAVIGLGSSTVWADPFTIVPGSPDNTGTDNVLFNDGSLLHSGLLVQGNFSGTGTGNILDFTSTSGNHLLAGGGGQATITGMIGNNPFTNLSFQLENGVTFTHAVFNIDLVNSDPLPNTVTIRVDGFDPGGVSVSQVFSVDVNGQNFFNVYANGTAVISKVTISTTDTTFPDINQFRLGGFSSGTAPVPEPASLLLLGTGLMGTAGALRRRLKAKSSK